MKVLNRRKFISMVLLIAVFVLSTVVYIGAGIFFYTNGTTELAEIIAHLIGYIATDFCLGYLFLI